MKYIVIVYVDGKPETSTVATADEDGSAAVFNTLADAESFIKDLKCKALILEVPC